MTGSAFGIGRPTAAEIDLQHLEQLKYNVAKATTVSKTSVYGDTRLDEHAGDGHPSSKALLEVQDHVKLVSGSTGDGRQHIFEKRSTFLHQCVYFIVRLGRRRYLADSVRCGGGHD
jgi:hypothetical protein